MLLEWITDPDNSTGILLALLFLLLYVCDVLGDAARRK